MSERIRLVMLLAGLAPHLPGGEVLDVHVRSGQIAYLEQEGQSQVILVTPRGEGTEVRVHPGDGVRFKRPFVRGFAILERDRLGVILSDQSRQDAAHQFILVYDLGQPGSPPAIWPAKNTSCARLGLADQNKLWCLGESNDRNLLHLLGPRGKLGGLIQKTPDLGTGSSRLGEPQLLAGRLGVVAWLPQGSLLVTVASATTGIQVPLPPCPETGRSLPTFALMDNGALIAMAPLLKDKEETPQTLYGLFVFVPAEEGWRRWRPEREFVRGTVLAGHDGQEAAIWRRGSRDVEFLQVK